MAVNDVMETNGLCSECTRAGACKKQNRPFIGSMDGIYTCRNGGGGEVNGHLEHTVFILVKEVY